MNFGPPEATLLLFTCAFAPTIDSPKEESKENCAANIDARGVAPLVR